MNKNRNEPQDKTTLDKWDSRFIDLATLVGSWSKDPSSRVGAVIVDRKKRVVSMGYNGFPRGVSDAKEIYDNRDEKYRRIIHAETNAILFAHHDIEGCSIYLTHQPCSQCAAKIIQSGIIRVIFPYSNDDFNRRWQNDIASAYEMFAEAKVEINFFGSSR